MVDQCPGALEILKHKLLSVVALPGLLVKNKGEKKTGMERGKLIKLL